MANANGQIGVYEVDGKEMENDDQMT